MRVSANTKEWRCVNAASRATRFFFLSNSPLTFFIYRFTRSLNCLSSEWIKYLVDNCDNLCIDLDKDPSDLVGLTEELMPIHAMQSTDGDIFYDLLRSIYIRKSRERTCVYVARVSVCFKTICHVASSHFTSDSSFRKNRSVWELMTLQFQAFPISAESMHSVRG